jgi:hypothetical protein
VSAPSAGNHPVWLLGLLALVAWQGWLTLDLFAAQDQPELLWDPEPILSGRHPLHLYHGCLGARVLQQRGRLSCYDPAFHAGYPKTPVFDGGSRPAELVLTLVAGRYCPAAYKLGVAALCVSVPWLLWRTARHLGLSRCRAWLAAMCGVLLWWGRPVRDALEAGDVHALLATLMLLVQIGLLVRYHRQPGPGSLLGLAAAGFLGWLAHPFFQALLLPLFLGYYLSVGPRHSLGWHFTLLLPLLLGAAANGFWLPDWLAFWWIRLPNLEAPAAHLDWRTVWSTASWSSPLERGLVVALLVLALVGIARWRGREYRPAGRLFGLALAGFLLLSLTGLVWDPLARLNASCFLAPTMLVAVLPAAHGLRDLAHAVRRTAGTVGLVLVGAAIPILGWLTVPAALADWTQLVLHPRPFRLGLGKERLALLEALRQQTTPDARILWEDRQGSRSTSHWTALLPLLTERAYVGGLDPDAGIEHTTAGLADQVLAGRPVRDWRDGELAEYCDRYNIGWIVAWSPAARARFAAWPAAEQVLTVQDDDVGALFRVRRRPAYALVGTAHVRQADAQRIVLGDVVPQQGQVILCMHYQKGMKANPSRVRVEGVELTGYDPVMFVRLRLDDPASRVTITWEKR